MSESDGGFIRLFENNPEFSNYKASLEIILGKHPLHNRFSIIDKNDNEIGQVWITDKQLKQAYVLIGNHLLKSVK